MSRAIGSRPISGHWRMLVVGTGVSAALLASPASAREYHVAPDGNNGGEGTAADPFETIQRAADLASPGDDVVVHAGTYRESIRPAKSGTSDAPIEFRASDGEDVLITGADLVSSSWTPTNGLWSTTVGVDFTSVYNQAPQIFVDGRMYFEARWPNTNPDAISTPAKATVDRFISKRDVNQPNGKCEWVFEDNELSGQPDLTGASIYMQPSDDSWSWTQNGVITKHAGARLTYLSFGCTGDDAEYGTLAEGARYYVFGKQALLDEAGEWFHDGTKLYIKGADPNSAVVENKQRDFAFDLSDRSHIIVRGFQLFGTTITTDVDAGTGTRDIPSWRQQPNESSKNIVIDGVNARYLTHADDLSGHMMGQWGQNTGIVLSGEQHKLINSSIQYSSGNGVSSIGVGHEIGNNLIADTNYNATEAGCIGDGFADISSDQVWHHNTCLRSGRSGLQLRSFRNSNKSNLVARIHHNIIANYGLQDFDVGAFYAPDDGAFARIDHNIFYRDQSAFFRFAIYFDESSANYIVDHNVAWGVWAGAGLTDRNGLRNILLYNNTLVAEGPGAPASVKVGGKDDTPCSDGCLIQNNLLKVGVWQNPNPVNQWPAYGSAQVVKNMLWGRDPEGHRSDIGKHLNPANRYEHDIGFESLAMRDYRLTAGSPAIDAGTPVGDLRRDGVRVGFDEAPDGKPDVGAYEYGQEPWKAGSSLEPIEYLDSPGKTPEPNPTAGTGGTSGTGGSGTDFGGEQAGNGSRDPSAESEGQCACRLERTSLPHRGMLWWSTALLLLLRRRRP